MAVKIVNQTAYEYLVSRQVTRLCHFTKTQSLVHILTSEDGILATQFIISKELHQNDMDRRDRRKDYVCCSVQYPNGWYWRKARDRNLDKVFQEWLVLTIDVRIIRDAAFQFCCCNAASASGSYIQSNGEQISTMFSSPTPFGARQRTPSMLPCCPTDDQAEILIYRNVPYRYITGIIVGNEASADHITAILKTVGKKLPVWIAPDVCNTQWSSKVRTGQVPLEIPYVQEGE